MSTSTRAAHLMNMSIDQTVASPATEQPTPNRDIASSLVKSVLGDHRVIGKDPYTGALICKCRTQTSLADREQHLADEIADALYG